MPNTHMRTIELNIIFIVVISCVDDSSKRKCKRGVDQVEKEHLIAGRAARVTRARSRQPL